MLWDIETGAKCTEGHEQDVTQLDAQDMNPIFLLVVLRLHRQGMDSRTSECTIPWRHNNDINAVDIFKMAILCDR